MPTTVKMRSNHSKHTLAAPEPEMQPKSERVQIPATLEEGRKDNEVRFSSFDEAMAWKRSYCSVNNQPHTNNDDFPEGDHQKQRELVQKLFNAMHNTANTVEAAIRAKKKNRDAPNDEDREAVGIKHHPAVVEVICWEVLVSVVKT
jgi:hypothetical protein